MRLYHWTWRYKVKDIRRDGFRPPNGGVFRDGLHTYDHPTAGRDEGYGDLCFVGDVPDDLLDPSWWQEQSHQPTKVWVLPYESRRTPSSCVRDPRR